MRVIRITQWMLAHVLSKRLIGFRFRGQLDAGWKLRTTFERAAEQFNVPPFLFANREEWTMREFRRRAHHYEENLPGKHEQLDWLALMQHYGAPTRLLDFTKSFYVAAFFAVERANTDAAVWAVNTGKLDLRVRETLALDYDPQTSRIDQINDNHIIKCNAALEKRGQQPLLVIPVEPERMNRRLATQQGSFLFPLCLERAFEENLLGSFRHDDSSQLSANEEVINDAEQLGPELAIEDVVKVILPREIHYDTRYYLRDVNITAETLFPGLDGFGRSLYWWFSLPVFSVQ